MTILKKTQNSVLSDKFDKAMKNLNILFGEEEKQRYQDIFEAVSQFIGIHAQRAYEDGLRTAFFLMA